MSSIGCHPSPEPNSWYQPYVVKLFLSLLSTLPFLKILSLGRRHHKIFYEVLYILKDERRPSAWTSECHTTAIFSFCYAWSLGALVFGERWKWRGAGVTLLLTPLPFKRIHRDALRIPRHEVIGRFPQAEGDPTVAKLTWELKPEKINPIILDGLVRRVSHGGRSIIASAMSQSILASGYFEDLRLSPDKHLPLPSKGIKFLQKKLKRNTR